MSRSREFTARAKYRSSSQHNSAPLEVENFRGLISCDVKLSDDHSASSYNGRSELSYDLALSAGDRGADIRVARLALIGWATLSSRHGRGAWQSIRAVRDTGRLHCIWTILLAVPRISGPKVGETEVKGYRTKRSR
jgi:hypothetical protein